MISGPQTDIVFSILSFKVFLLYFFNKLSNENGIRKPIILVLAYAHLERIPPLVIT